MEITGWFLMVYLFSATDISSLSDRFARIIKFFHTHHTYTHTHTHMENQCYESLFVYWRILIMIRVYDYIEYIFIDHKINK